jgi:thiamine transport system permease protein
VASVLALLQLVCVAVILVLQDRLSRRWRDEGVVSAPPRLRATTRRQRAWVAGNLAALGVLLGGPLAVLVERSFRIGDGHGLGNWRALAHRRSGTGLFVPPLEAVGNSLRFAVAATGIAVVLGLLAATGLARSRGRGSRIIDAVLLVPLGTSAVTVGFGFLIALDEPVDLRSNPWLVPLAQAVVALPFVVRTITPVLRSVAPRQREAAALLGAGPLRAWWEVDRRFVRRAVLVSTGFAFAISLGEFGATTVIARADRPTVPVVIGRLLARPGPGNSGQAYALGVVLMVVTACSVAVVDRSRRSRPGVGGWW